MKGQINFLLVTLVRNSEDVGKFFQADFLVFALERLLCSLWIIYEVFWSDIGS